MSDLIGAEFLLSMAVPIRLVILLLLLWVGVRLAVGGGKRGQQAILGEHSMGTSRWTRTDRKPILGAVDIHSDVPLDSFPFMQLHRADMVDELAFEVFLSGLNEQPPLISTFDTVMAQFDS